MASRAMTRLGMQAHALPTSAETPWLHLLASDVTTADYVYQLGRVYGFEAPLEAALAYTPHLGRVIDLRRRARAGLLAQDLIALGVGAVQLARLPHCQMIAPFATLPEALGWMYVLERATFLHDSVRRHLLRQEPALATACAYLAANEDTVATRWLELEVVVESVGRAPRASDQIMAAAIYALRCAEDWYSSPPSPATEI